VRRFFSPPGRDGLRHRPMRHQKSHWLHGVGEAIHQRGLMSLTFLVFALMRPVCRHEPAAPIGRLPNARRVSRGYLIELGTEGG